jgi:ferric-dicitrate binding protein FerR (iron transport regulator)
MSASVPPRDGDALTGSPSSLTPYPADEAALRQLFDAQYGTRITTARTELGDAAAQAPRIVETAFVNAWARRHDLHDAAQFDAVIADEVHHGAARALSRRAAAHRFGSHGGREEVHTGTHAVDSPTGDPAGSWSRVLAAIHSDGAGSHAAHDEAGRHEAARHMKAVAKRPSWIAPVAFAVVALAAVLAGMLYFDRLGEDDATLSAVSSPLIQPIVSPPGQFGSTTLADGTKLRFGPETKVFVPDGFPKKMRAVRVEGTAQFDVAPNQALPFRVFAKRTQIIATGTSFVVSAYPNDSAVAVLVREGSVTLKSGKQSSSVAVNQPMIADRTAIRPASDAERTQAFEWTDGRVTVAHRQLRDVVAQLTRWFNLDIKVPDLALLDRDASFSASLDSSRVAIAQVEKSANVKFAYEGESKVFRDAKPK